MKKNKPFARKQALILMTIIGLAFTVRTLFLSNSPARLTADELSIGYNAYSIFHTGKDEWGRSFPLVFQAFGDWKLPGYIYAAVPFVGMLGLSMVSVKIPSVLAGLIVVLTGYLTAKQLASQRTAVFTGLVLALSPWPVHLSRSALESNLALALFCVGFYFCLRYFEGRKHRDAIVAGLLMATTFYCYVAYRLLVVLIMGVLVLLFAKVKSYRGGLVRMMIAFVALLLPLIFVLFSASGTARFDQVSIFRGDALSLSVNENRSFCYLIDPTLLNDVCKIFFHKPEVIVKTLAANYFEFLSPAFLFIEGDSLQYLAVPGYGEFFFFLLPFFVWGFVEMFKRFNKKWLLLMLIFLLGPLPAALVGTPQVVRGSILILPVGVLTGLGLSQFYQWLGPLKPKIRWAIYGVSSLAVTFFVVQFYIAYFFLYPTQFDNAAYHVPQQISAFLWEKYDQYDEIYINNRMNDFYIFLAFYQQMDPNWLSSHVVRPEPDAYGFSHPIKLAKYTFDSMNLETLVCDEARGRVYFMTDVSERIPIAPSGEYTVDTFYNFSHVHLQANGVDVGAYREYLKSSGLWLKACK